MVGVKLVLTPRLGNGEPGTKFEVPFPNNRLQTEITPQVVGGMLHYVGKGVKVSFNPDQYLLFSLEDDTAQKDEVGVVDKKRHALTKLNREELRIITQGLGTLVSNEGIPRDDRDDAKRLLDQLTDKMLRLKDPTPPKEDE